MKKATLLIAMTVCLSCTCFAQDTTKKKPVAPVNPVPITYSIKGLTMDQVQGISRMADIAKETVPYSNHINDHDKISIIVNIDAFKEILNTKVVQDQVKVDSVKTAAPAAKKKVRPDTKNKN